MDYISISSVNLISSIILDYSCGFRFKCCCHDILCNKEIWINNFNQDMIDIDLEMKRNDNDNDNKFNYYFVEDRFVNEENIDNFNYVNDKYGYIRIFLHDCDGIMKQYQYCDNYDYTLYTDSNGKQKSICYQCEKCGVYIYELEKERLNITEICKCTCCEMNFCIKCMNQY